MENLIDLNHAALVACGVSHETLERVRRVTAKVGLHSKLTGAGGGGCALTFIRSGTPPEIISQVVRDLEAEGFECFETSIGGAGLKANHCPIEDGTGVNPHINFLKLL